MKLAILDDETHAGETMRMQLVRLGRSEPDIHVFSDVFKALEQLPALNPDVLFLDIEMPGMNGFQFLKALGRKDLKVIFTTAYDQFAIKAFRVNALDYLLKPVEDSALKESLERLDTGAAAVRLEDIRSVFDAFMEGRNGSDKIALPTVYGLDFVRKEDILFCGSESNYTRLYLPGGKRMLIAKTLKEVEHLLGGFPFCRVHNSYVVNTRRVEKYLRSDGGKLLMENGAEIRISRSRKEEVLKILGVV